MGGYELHELLGANREMISDTWNFFLSVHLAVLGIIFIASGRISFLHRIVLVGAYIGFMYINYRAQLDNYAVHEAIIAQINGLDTVDGEVARALIKTDPTWIVDYLEYVFATAAIVCSSIILFLRRG